MPESNEEYIYLVDRPPLSGDIVPKKLEIDYCRLFIPSFYKICTDKNSRRHFFQIKTHAREQYRRIELSCWAASHWINRKGRTDLNVVFD
jgi:hypothetical protein